MTAGDGPVPTVTRGEIVAALGRLGVVPGDVVLVHSSLSRFGRVAGGAEAVGDALLEAVGPDGLVVMPSFTRCRVAAERPEPEAYDPATTPCRARTGVIPDSFWRRPEARRSRHPTHSLAAIGARADEFVEGGERRCFDPAGPFGRYARWGGKAVFLGASLGSNTTCHCAEDWLAMPFLKTERARVRRPDGSVQVVQVTGSPSAGCRSYYGGGGVVKQAFLEAGALRSTWLNRTELQMIAATDILRVIAEQEERTPGFLLCREHEDDFCRAGIAACLERRAEVLAAIETLRRADWRPPAAGGMGQGG